jgi:GDPmannose 4,6-dehydratase
MAVKKALITGLTGQDGSYLAELLIEKGYQVFGLVRRSSSSNVSRISHLSGNIQILSGDLLDQCSLMDAIAESQPDELYNLASQSYVPTSWTQPALTAEYTAIGVSRLLESIRRCKPISGSTKPPAAKSLVNPTNPLKPNAPHSVPATPTVSPKPTPTG